MRSYILAHWRLLRPLVALILCASILISYIYLKSQPSYGLYRTLAEQEIETSRKFIRNNRESKYVLFKQLRGAGFNNQVSSCPCASIVHNESDTFARRKKSCYSTIWPCRPLACIFISQLSGGPGDINPSSHCQHFWKV
jgi:hypothetical protein